MGRGAQALARLCSPTPFCLSWPPWLSLKAEGASPSTSALLPEPEPRLPLSTKPSPRAAGWFHAFP